MRNGVRSFIFMAVVLAGARGGFAQDGAQLFDEFYATKVRQVRATNDRADDVALAQELLAAAEAPNVPPGLHARQLDSAYELASTDDRGTEVALKAAQLLGERFPERQAVAHERVIAVRQRQFARGQGDDKVRASVELIADLERAADHQIAQRDLAAAVTLLRRAMVVAQSQRLASRAPLNARIDALQSRQRAEQRVETLKASLRSDPGPGKADLAREIAMAYLIDLDQPEEAARLGPLLQDAELAKKLELAARRADQLGEAEALELAEWYRSLFATADAAARPALVERAQAYYRRYLDLHPQNDLARTRAKLVLQDLESQAQAMGPPPLRGAQVQAVWTILFESDDPATWDPAKAPPEVRYLRLKRMDTGDFVIIAVSRDQLKGVTEGEHMWNGTNKMHKDSRGDIARRLGIGKKSWRHGYTKGAQVVEAVDHKDGYGGWGFGRHCSVFSKQIQLWEDKVIPATVMQIAVTPGPLSSDDEKRLLK